jgi:tetratricopeptide (TPR) repeat protein
MSARTSNPAARSPRGLLVNAALLARKGRYGEASELIARARASDRCPQAAALDLQARIFVQQGQLLRAEACWTEALQLDPANLAYVEALAQLRRSASPMHRLRANLLALCAVVAVAAALWFAHSSYDDARRQQEAAAAGVAHLERSVEKLSAAQTAALAAYAQHAAELSARVAQSHVAIRKLGRRLDRSTTTLGRQIAAIGGPPDRTSVPKK